MSFKQLCLGITAAILACSACNASTIISGTPSAEQQPFPFALGSFYYNPQTLAVFVGAGTVPGTDYRTMSISYANAAGTAFSGLTPEKVKLNGVATQPNPLFGAVISQLSFSDKAIVAVSQTQPNILYLIRYYTSPTTMEIYSAGPLKDANGGTSQGVIALAGSPHSTIFAFALLPATGSFGDSGSQISYGSLFSVPDAPGSKTSHMALNITNGIRIERSSSLLKIQSDLASIGSTATIQIAERFIPLPEEVLLEQTPLTYIGITAVGGSGATDGVRGVVANVGAAIAPDAAIEANSIIGGVGPNAEVHINQIKTLYTSTQLHYLIVAGGVGTAAETAQSVYALPLSLSGVLAKKTAIPQTAYNQSGGFYYRYLNDPAAAAGDLFSPNSTSDIQKARVGGTATLPGAISSLFTTKDSVFVTIDADGATTLGGIFCSQALFDSLGRIQGWTNWRRVNGFTTPTAWATMDPLTGNVWAAVHGESDILNTILRSSWSANGAFTASVNNLFLDQQPGTQGLIDFPHELTAFSQILGNRISVILATGYNRIALIQSGADMGIIAPAVTAESSRQTRLPGFFTPTQALTSTYKSTTGAVGTFPTGTDSIVISGGALDALGGIVTAEIVSDGTYSWLLAGGNGGLAVLARPDSSGWVQGDLGGNFFGLPSDAAFRIIGNFRDVRKVIADGANIYILTNTECRRFTASQANFAAATMGQELGTLLASSTSLETVFGGAALLSDLIVSGPLALIATNRGLVRVGNGQSIALDDAATLNWQQIFLPEAAAPVTRFYLISPTGMQNEWATTASGGNVYVLSGAVGRSQTRVHRLAVTGLTTSITDDTVQLFEDHFMRDVNPSFFLSRGDYRNNLAYDGTICYLMRSRYHPYGTVNGAPLMESMGAWLRTGAAFVEQGATALVAPTGADMGPLIYRSAQGSMMTGGSSMYANE